MTSEPIALEASAFRVPQSPVDDVCAGKGERAHGGEQAVAGFGIEAADPAFVRSQPGGEEGKTDQRRGDGRITA